MRLRIERDALVGALKAVIPAVGKTPLPVLTGVRIDTGAGRVDFTCSNLDLTIKATLDGVDDDPGVAIVPAGLLERIARVLPAGAVELVTDDHQLTITCGDTCAELRTIEPEGWPQLPKVETDSVTLGEQALDDLRHIVPMASPDRTRKGVWGVQFAGTRAVATDSYRMAAVDLGVQVAEVIVPATPLATVLRAATGELTMAVDPRAVAFKGGRVTWTTTVVEDEFPNVDQFLERRPPRRLELPGPRLAESIDRVVTVGADQTGDLLRLAVDGGKVIVSRRQADVGSVADTVPCGGDWEGHGAFNPRFLGELVDAVASHQDEIVLEIDPADAGCLLKPVLARTERFTLLLMPVRIKEPG